MKILVLLSTALMLVVNVLSNVLPFNNQTTAQISDSFDVFFVPAGYVFSIWGIIYSAVIAFNIYLFYPRKKDDSKTSVILKAVVITNIANSVWIFLWHYNQLALSVVVMLVLLLALIYIYLKFSIRKDLTSNEVYFVKLPFSIYLGWISVATIANITVALYSLGWNSFGIEGSVWASILVVIAAVLAIVMLLRHSDVAFASVIIWALVGIGVKFSDNSLLNSISYASGLVIILIVVYTVYKKYFKKV